MVRWTRRKVLLEKSLDGQFWAVWNGRDIGTTYIEEVDMESLEICTIMRFSVEKVELKWIRDPIFDIIYDSPQAHQPSSSVRNGRRDW